MPWTARFLALSCLTLTALVAPPALPALAAPHAGFHPLPVRQVATFRRSGSVGPMVFCLAFPDAQSPRPPAALDRLTFRLHQPPAAWWGRSYHPCTLNDAVASLPDAARDFRVATVVLLDGQRVSATAFDLADEHLGPSWNTLSWEGATIHDHLTGLGVGRHHLTVWRQLHYRLPAKDRQTGDTVWEPRMLALAKGELPILVQP